MAKQDDRVYRVFNNIYPVKVQPAQNMAALDFDGAYDAAWHHLRAQSELGGAPRARLVYTPEGDSFRLNYVVDLALSAPDGAWSVRVDAVTGAVSRRRGHPPDSQDHRRNADGRPNVWPPSPAPPGIATATFDAFDAKEAGRRPVVASGTRAPRAPAWSSIPIRARP